MSGQVYGVPFAQIPEWILDAEISDRAVRLFCVLHRHANSEGRAFPGRTAISERLKCSTGSVDRALNELRGIAAIVSRQKKVGPAIVGNDYWLWPAQPSSQVETGSPTDEARGSPTADATVALPVARQENESHRNESQEEREPSLAVVTSDDEPKTKRAVPFPSEFFVTPEMREWATENVPTADVRSETEQFCDFHRARGKPGKDWVAAWRYWMRNSVKFAAQRGNTQRSRSQRNNDAISNVIAMTRGAEQKALPL
jgi:hypothetical protein